MIYLGAEAESRFVLFARHKNARSIAEEIGVIFLKTQDELGLMQEALTEKPVSEVYDWFYYALTDSNASSMAEDVSTTRFF